MVRLPFNMLGYVFQKDLSDIRRAYDATIMALESNRAKLASELSDFAQAVSAGAADAWDYDDDGERLYSREQMQELLIEDATSTITVAREAYIVILHHYLEKQCKEWMKVKEYKFSEAYDHLQARGLAIDRPNLETLRLACNEIKHGNRPSKIHACDVDQMFEAVKISGIQTEWAQGDLQPTPAYTPKAQGIA